MPRITDTSIGGGAGQGIPDFNPAPTLQVKQDTAPLTAVSTEPTKGQKLLEALGMGLPAVHTVVNKLSDEQKAADADAVYKEKLDNAGKVPALTGTESSWYRQANIDVATNDTVLAAMTDWQTQLEELQKNPEALANANLADMQDKLRQKYFAGSGDPAVAAQLYKKIEPHQLSMAKSFLALQADAAKTVIKKKTDAINTASSQRFMQSMLDLKGDINPEAFNLLVESHAAVVGNELAGKDLNDAVGALISSGQVNLASIQAGLAHKNQNGLSISARVGSDALKATQTRMQTLIDQQAAIDREKANEDRRYLMANQEALWSAQGSEGNLPANFLAETERILKANPADPSLAGRFKALEKQDDYRRKKQLDTTIQREAVVVAEDGSVYVGDTQKYLPNEKVAKASTEAFKSALPHLIADPDKLEEFVRRNPQADVKGVMHDYFNGVQFATTDAQGNVNPKLSAALRMYRLKDPKFSPLKAIMFADEDAKFVELVDKFSGGGIPAVTAITEAKNQMVKIRDAKDIPERMKTETFQSTLRTAAMKRVLRGSGMDNWFGINDYSDNPRNRTIIGELIDQETDNVLRDKTTHLEDAEQLAEKVHARVSERLVRGTSGSWLGGTTNWTNATMVPSEEAIKAADGKGLLKVGFNKRIYEQAVQNVGNPEVWSQLRASTKGATVHKKGVNFVSDPSDPSGEYLRVIDAETGVMDLTAGLIHFSTLYNAQVSLNQRTGRSIDVEKSLAAKNPELIKLKKELEDNQSKATQQGTVKISNSMEGLPQIPFDIKPPEIGKGSSLAGMALPTGTPPKMAKTVTKNNDLSTGFKLPESKKAK